MKNDVVVSICCITYNQENYIREALESFINQKLDVKFEIIISDDASTDNTANIIKEYEKKYPDIIKPIYQKENQYSKNKKLFPIVFEKAKGKYIALCEGDDYWCDKYKLQKQLNFMRNNSDCSLITTGAKIYDDLNKKFKNKKQPYYGSRYYSTEEIIYGDGDLFSTNSMFFESKYVREIPKFYYLVPFEDFPLTIHLALCGRVYYLKDITSVYRTNAKGSWTSKMKQSDYLEKKKKIYKSLKEMFYEINIQTKYIYKNVIDDYLLKRKFEIAILTNNIDEIKNRKYKKLYKIGNIKQRIKFYIKIKLGKLNINYKNIK